MLSELEILAHVRVWREQIIKRFLIDFEVIDLKFDLSAVGFNDPVDLVEDVRDCPWNDSVKTLYFFRDSCILFDNALCNRFHNDIRSQHSVCLSGTTLPVHEDCSIVPIEELSHGIP